MRLQLIIRGFSFIVLICVAGCSSPPATEFQIQTAISKTQEYETYLWIAKEATEKARPTETPKPTPRPTRTPTVALPDYCFEDANPYLDEVDRIITEITDSVNTWNNSARGDQELLEHELRLRSLVEQADELTPPSDFKEMHEHFIAYVHGTLNATFGVIENNEENRKGNNETYLNEFDLALEAWDDAINNRERSCDHQLNLY
jgi:hypothetical protein